MGTEGASCPPMDNQVALGMVGRRLTVRRHSITNHSRKDAINVIIVVPLLLLLLLGFHYDNYLAKTSIGVIL